MVKKIIQLGDKKLNLVSEEVKKSEISSRETQELVSNLYDTLDSNREVAAGLSAVQIGELKRIFAVKRLDLKNDNEAEEIEILINPEIEVLDETLNLEWEGCMSISNQNRRLYGPVSRPRTVKVHYYDINGVEQSIIATGFFSSLMQHEYDHLEGILFLKYVTNPKNIWNEDELNAYLDTYKQFPKAV